MAFTEQDWKDFMSIPERMKTPGFDRPRWVEEPDDRSIVFTPNKTVEDMLDLLPSDTWTNPDLKFLNICCKNGEFIEAIFWRLFEGLRGSIRSNWRRSDHILTKQIYALGMTEELSKQCRSVLYGNYKANHEFAFTKQFDTEEGNIRMFEHKIPDYTFNYKEIVQEETGVLMKKTIEEVFGDVKFDVVIGNPPYNRGMDIDFVDKAFKMSERYVVMITPAKWQTAEADQRIASTMSYGQFRKEIVPYMSKVVFYPDSKDVFEIKQVDGISYYLIDKKDKNESVRIENISKKYKSLNSVDTRSIIGGDTLLNKGKNIIDHIENTKSSYPKLRFKKNDLSKKYKVVAVTKIPGLIDTNKAEEPVYITSIYRIKQDYTKKPDRDVIFSSDSKEECESFVSFMYTRLVRFMYLANVSKLSSPYTNHCFRFVPEPPSGKFDHIYTDEELYKAFNLPQKYIDVIEAVVKERK